MHRKKIIKEFNRVFCEAGKESKRYSLVWLEDANFGGLYHSGDFILHVQAQQKIEDRSQKIMNIFHMLNEKAKEEFKYIWRVVIHNQNDEIDCESRNVVYEEESF